MKKVLFVCYFGRDRSRTAAEMFKTWPDCEARFGGVSVVAEQPLSEEDIVWADMIFTMEAYQVDKLRKRYGGVIKEKSIICLDIPDIFGFKDARLHQIFRKKVGPYLAPTQ